MASIREHIETTFAALAFAEKDRPQEARDLLDEARERATPVAVRRADSRPRVRV